MSSASVSPYGFVTVRRRGYRPGQVDAQVAALCRARDAAWERAARLTVLAKEMEAQAAGLRETVARLAPQTYEALGERAQSLLRLARDEAAAVREHAREHAREQVARARADALEAGRAAREHADEVGAPAEESARQRLLTARAEADGIRIATRREVKRSRGEVLSALREVRTRTAAMRAAQAKEQAEQWAQEERAALARADALDAHQAGLAARAEAALAEARRAFADAEQSAARRQEEAQAQAAGLLARARAQAEGISRDTEQVLREHGEQWDEVRAHMDHVRSRLSALTGRTASVEQAP
ncbi:cellulose-binding protein [Streptomyces sp. NPDC059766]|uniref:cellulose-binding protein n=1 Tax=Streptomyces sp. NPDC059766 TaxID=3346940 RepID=UPI0036694448